MKFLLVYKGDYLANLRGPEIRYVALASELVGQGHEVIVSGRSADRSRLPVGVRFIAVTDFLELAISFARTDVVVLHGGGAVLLLFALIAGFCGKKLILDSYAPQWIEQDVLLGRKEPCARIKTLARSYFNVARNLLGGLAFDSLIVANKRQLDLMRGLLVPFSLTHNFKRVSIIPFGCHAYKELDRQQGRSLLGQLAGRNFKDDDFLIGWLGGAYEWFDLASVMREVSRSIAESDAIKIIFFGIEEARRVELLDLVDPVAKGNVFFLPWVDFSRRFEYWSGLDISLVWGAEGYENDYASRTRNFDCLTLGLPIVQNRDDEWGARLALGGGLVVDESSLSRALLDLSNSPGRLFKMRQVMQEMTSLFSWEHFSSHLCALVSDSPPMGLLSRGMGLIGFLLLLPTLLFFFVCALVKTVSRA